MPESIILDCDPGHDDAIALMLAAGHPDIDLVGITTVAGNQTIDKVTRNALSICTLARLDVPVAQGAARPLVRDQIVAPDIHGASGLEGPVLPQPDRDVDPRHAVRFLIDEIMARPPKTLTLVPTGPLTNIALTVREEPRIVERVKQVSLMGGAFGRGNRSPVAEFNVLADPEAAAIVFEAGWPIMQAGLDVTHCVRATPDVLDRFRGLDSDLGRFVVAALTSYGEAYRRAQGFADPPVHDPVAVAAVADPSLMTFQGAFVAVELNGTWTYGQTVTDFRGQLGHAPNTRVITACRTDAFWAQVLDAVARLGAGIRTS